MVRWGPPLSHAHLLSISVRCGGSSTILLVDEQDHLFRPFRGRRPRTSWFPCVTVISVCDGTKGTNGTKDGSCLLCERV